MMSGSLSSQLSVSSLQMEEHTPDMEGSCEYVE